MKTVVPIAIVNAEPQRHISVLDRGLAYGDGVFETMVAGSEDIPLWRLHYDRLCRGLLALDIPLETSALAKQVQAVLASKQFVESKSGQVIVKLMVTRGEGGRGYQSPEQTTPNLIAILSPLSLSQYVNRGVKVHYCRQLLSPQPLAGIKTLNQLAYVLASQERLGRDCGEGLLFNDQGQLIEATARNVFLVDKEMQLLTPKLDQYGVEGVMRRLIIDTIAPKLNIDVKQAVVTKADIANAEELFLTNSVTHIWPVIDCEGRQWRRGPITMAIQHCLTCFLQDEKYLSYSQHSAMQAALKSG